MGDRNGTPRRLSRPQVILILAAAAAILIGVYCLLLRLEQNGRNPEPTGDPNARYASDVTVEYDGHTYRQKRIVPTIRTVSNSLSLLNSNRLKNLLDLLAEYFDYVIVDAPPIGALIDAAQIARFCDGILMIVNYDAVRKKELVDAQKQLEQTGCPILGTVINQARLDSFLNRKYYYKSYYYSHYDQAYEKAQRTGKKKGFWGKLTRSRK